MSSLIKKPSAWLPLAMSSAALVFTLGYLALYGITEPQPQKDEGTAAHIFQLMMGGQLPIIAFFTLRYLPQMPKQALFVLALQLATGLGACAPIFILKM